MDQIDWEDVEPWTELRAADTEQLIAELTDYKRGHYPNELRRIVATEMSPVFATPSLPIDPGEREWLAHFHRALPDAAMEDR